MTFSNFKNRKGQRLDTSFHQGGNTNCLVILGHGVTGNKDRPLLIAVAEGLAQRGWPCLRMSFAGNGASDGRFEDSNISSNAEDIADVIASLPSNIKVAYCGHSMGAAAGVCCSASEESIRVLVSLAGMVQTKAFFQREFGTIVVNEGTMWDDPQFPLSSTYANDLLQIGDTLSRIRELKAPLLLIHGSNDDVVLPEDSKLALDNAPGPKKLVLMDGAEHSFGEQYYPRIVEEIDQWLNLFLCGDNRVTTKRLND